MAFSIRSLFVNPQEHRLRCGWRLLLFLLLGTLLFVPLGFLLAWIFAPNPPAWAYHPAASEALIAVHITLSVALARRWLDRRPWKDLGLAWDPQAPREMLFGIGLSGLMMGSIFLTEWALGWAQITEVAWQRLPWARLLPLLGEALLLWILVGWTEELLFRGYLLTNLREGLNLPWAVFLTSLFFALVHWGNPNWTPAALGGIFLAGLFLAAGWLTTRRLWLPIGLHIGWNLFEGTVFGFPVSGLHLPSLITLQVQGPSWLTGGAFGPEAGLILVPALIGGTWIMYRWRAKAASPPPPPAQGVV